MDTAFIKWMPFFVKRTRFLFKGHISWWKGHASSENGCGSWSTDTNLSEMDILFYQMAKYSYQMDSILRKWIPFPSKWRKSCKKDKILVQRAWFVSNVSFSSSKRHHSLPNGHGTCQMTKILRQMYSVLIQMDAFPAQWTRFLLNMHISYQTDKVLVKRTHFLQNWYISLPKGHDYTSNRHSSRPMVTILCQTDTILVKKYIISVELTQFLSNGFRSYQKCIVLCQMDGILVKCANSWPKGHGFCKVDIFFYQMDTFLCQNVIVFLPNGHSYCPMATITRKMDTILVKWI